MAGYDVDEFSHQIEEFKKRVHRDDISSVMGEVQNHLEGKLERFLVEFRFLKKDNSWLWILGRGSIVEKDEKGLPLKFLGTHTDITERKLAEENLKERNRELEIFNDVTVDREFRIIELKKEINELIERTGEKPKYEIPV